MQSGVEDHFASAAQTFGFASVMSTYANPFSQTTEICTEKVVRVGGEFDAYRLFCRVRFDVAMPQSIAINIEHYSLC